MIARLAFLLACFSLFFFLGAVAAQENRTESQTWLSGGELPHRVRLTAVDEDAFMRRVNRPPALDEEPETAGPSYIVESPYWDEAVRAGDEAEDPVELEAVYYPEGGFVRARQAGDDVWLVIDLRQRAILDRYIRLTAAGVLDERPGPVELLVAAVQDGELVSLQIGERHLDEEETVAFWQLAAKMTVFERLETDPWQPVTVPGSVWLIFNLPEGRALQMLYIPANGLLYDSLGATAYVVPFRWLEPVLGEDTPEPGEPIDFAGAQIEQEETSGSALWWPVMIGAGCFCLGLAVWLQRRWSRV